MAEQMKSITDARKNLPGLSQAAQRKMDRYVITHQGQPQSVLVGWSEYQGMKALQELMNQPEALASLRRGLSQAKAGKRLTSEQVLAQLRESRKEAKSQEMTATLANKAGVQPEVVHTVMCELGGLLKEHQGGYPITIPGVGEIILTLPVLKVTAPGFHSSEFEVQNLTKKEKARK
jgi:PHD/YefM family antitoxin component YafN of YafNO toxin-antitoxin module